MSEPRDPHVRELVVELVETAPPAPPFPHPDALPRERRTWRRPVLTAATIVLLLAVALGAVALLGDGGRSDGRKTPYVTTPGVVGGVSRSIAYVAADGLYVLPAGGGAAKRIAEGQGIVRPQWSHDGKYLSYERAGEVHVVKSDGREDRDRLPGDRAAWSPDRDWLAVRYYDDQENAFSVTVITAMSMKARYGERTRLRLGRWRSLVPGASHGEVTRWEDASRRDLPEQQRGATRRRTGRRLVPDQHNGLRPLPGPDLARRRARRCGPTNSTPARG